VKIWGNALFILLKNIHCSENPMMMKSNTWFVLRTCTGIALPKRSILLSIIDLQSFKHSFYHFAFVEENKKDTTYFTEKLW
jgi:hypothetical protein